MILSLVLILFVISIIQNIAKVYSGDTFEPKEIRVEILNGCGENGAAMKMRSSLIEKGYNVVSFGNAMQYNFERTLVVNRGGNADVTDHFAKDIGCRNRITQVDTTAYVDVLLILGKDYGKYLN
jgi:hypothetical protein